MEPLNIAFFTDSYLPAVDGVVISINNFKEELERRGHNVYIFSAGPPKRKDSPMPNVFLTKGIRFRKYPQYTLAMFPFMSSLKVKQLGIDVIHAHTPFMMGVSSLMIAKLNKIPIVGSFHTMFTDKAVIREYASQNPLAVRLADRYSWSYARFFYNKCNSVIAPSAATQSLLKAERIANTTVVENGVDTRLFNTKASGAATRRLLLGKSEEKLVLYVGRISKEKKISTLIKAAHHLKRENIRFVAVGTGPALPHYKKMARSYGLNNFKFAGFVANSELPKYYAAADLFCIPSTFETQGIVCLEAMACGKPVVAADYMALHSLIQNGKNGEKFRPQSSIDCAHKIEKVLHSPSRYTGMKETTEKFSVERTTDKLLKVYKSLLT